MNQSVLKWIQLIKEDEEEEQKKIEWKIKTKTVRQMFNDKKAFCLFFVFFNVNPTKFFNGMFVLRIRYDRNRNRIGKKRKLNDEIRKLNYLLPYFLLFIVRIFAMTLFFLFFHPPIVFSVTIYSCSCCSRRRNT